MNDNEKNLIEENVSAVDEAQTIKRVEPIDENSSINQIDENTSVNNLEASGELLEIAPSNQVDTTIETIKNVPIEKVDEQSEKVKVKPLEEPSKDVLFGGYELKTWEFSPRIYKIIAGAAVFNLLTLLVVAQTNMLGTSACNSPFVKRVCQVIDTVVVGKKLFDGSGGGYERVETPGPEIDDAEVVWVDTTNIEPQIQYPEDYFQIANRDEILARKELMENVDQNAYDNATTTPYTPPPFSPKLNNPPSSSGGSKSSSRGFGRGSRKSRGGNSLLSRKAKPPTKLKDPTNGTKVNSSLFELEDGDTNGNETVAKKPEDTKEKPITKKNPIAENTAVDSESEEDVAVNKLPLEKFVIDILENKAVNEVVIKKPFAAKYQASINKDGTFKDNKFRPLVQNGDKEILELINNGVKALGASKFLKHLANLDVKDIELTIIQDDNEFKALIVSSQPSKESARTMASGLNSAISLGKYFKNQEINGKEKDPNKLQGEKDELFLLNNASVTSQDKNFIFTIKLPRAEFQELTKRRLAQEAKKREADPKYGVPDKPSGSAKTPKADSKKAL